MRDERSISETGCQNKRPCGLEFIRSMCSPLINEEKRVLTMES